MSGRDRERDMLRVGELVARYRTVLMGRKWFVIDGEKGGTLPDDHDDEIAARVAARRAAATAICDHFDTLPVTR